MLRFLMLVISLLSGAAYWVWASQPLWVSSAYQSASYIGYSEPDQTVVALVQEENGAYFEWRELLTGKVVKRVPLQLEGPPQAILAYFNSQLAKSDHDLALVYIREQTGKRRTLPFMLNTGKPVATVDELLPSLFVAEVRGQRCALSTPSTLLLVDGEQQGFRQLKIAKIDSVRLLADGKFLAITQPDALLILNWKTGEIITRNQLQPADRYTLFVSSRNDIYLFHYGVHPQRTLHVQRWVWDGEQLKAATPPMPLPQATIGQGGEIIGNIITEDRDGLISVACYANETWPAKIRPALDWLTKRGFQVDKYYSRRILMLSAVIDRNGSILRKFEYDATCREFKFNQYQLCTRRADTQTVISLHHTNPVWPNAIAVAMMVYLLGYVYRYRQVRVT